MTVDRDSPHAPQSQHIRQLRIERRDLLKAIAEATRTRVEKGQASLDELRNALVAQRKAELELCETPAERVHVHEQLVDDLRDVEKLFEKWWSAGRVVQSAVYETRARRLKAEIDLA